MVDDGAVVVVLQLDQSEAARGSDVGAGNRKKCPRVTQGQQVCRVQG